MLPVQSTSGLEYCSECCKVERNNKTSKHPNYAVFPRSTQMQEFEVRFLDQKLDSALFAITEKACFQAAFARAPKQAVPQIEKPRAPHTFCELRSDARFQNSRP